ncbi:L-glyceraldehyde 3-phosphate reductase [compost metagenome]
MEELASELGITLSQFALAWVLRQPNVSSAIIGSSRPSQIEENIKAIEIELSDEALARTEDILSMVSGFAPMR